MFGNGTAALFILFERVALIRLYTLITGHRIDLHLRLRLLIGRLFLLLARLFRLLFLLFSGLLSFLRLVNGFIYNVYSFYLGLAEL